MGQQGLRYMPWLLQVGGFTIFRNEDLGNVLPLWIKYTEDVREDPDVRPCLMSRKRLQNETCMKSNGMLSLLCLAGDIDLNLQTIESVAVPCRHGTHRAMLTRHMLASSLGLLRCELYSASACMLNIFE